MPSVLQYPSALESRIQQIYSDPALGFAWAEYVAGRNGVIDPLLWLEKADAKRHGEIFANLAATYKRPFVPLAQTNCHSAAVMLYLEALEGAKVDVSQVLSACPPVPLGVVGHVLVFAHCDPSEPQPSELPRHLTTIIWVSVDDYLKARDDFRDRASTLRSGVTPRTFEGITGAPTSESLRSVLEWAMKLPTVDSTERNAVDFVLSLTDSELVPQRLPSDLRCSLESRANTNLLVPGSALRVNPAAMVGIKNRSRCTELGFVPYAVNKRHVLVAVEKETNSIFDELARTFPGLKPIIAIVSSDAIRYLLNESTRSKGGVASQQAISEEDLKGVQWVIDTSKYDGKTPRGFSDIEELLQFFLSDGTGQRASDIHIDIFHNHGRVRYAVDGRAVGAWSMPADLARRLSIKLRDTVCKKGAETESPTAPQEGSFSYAYLGKRVMCRVTIAYNNNDSNQPKIVQRILDTSAGVRDLSLMGLYPDELAIIRRNITRRQGLFICSGPTGSGKSTTLNACLQDINSPSRIIYTLEDPIEYRIPGVTQLAVASKEDERAAGRITFAEGLRLLLRMDPDVIMVGEVRDKDTASMAVEAANTGHLIMTTIHANSSIDIIKRLFSMEVDPTNLGGNAKLLSAQRLVPKLCTCRKQVVITDEQAKLFESKGVKHGRWVCEPVGCPRCRNTGYHGRSVILELLEVTTEIADLISERAPITEIRKATERAKGFVPLITSGLRRVASEQTSFEALFEVVDA